MEASSQCQRPGPLGFFRRPWTLQEKLVATLLYFALGIPALVVVSAFLVGPLDSSPAVWCESRQFGRGGMVEVGMRLQCHPELRHAGDGSSSALVADGRRRLRVAVSDSTIARLLPSDEVEARAPGSTMLQVRYLGMLQEYRLTVVEPAGRVVAGSALTALAVGDSVWVPVSVVGRDGRQQPWRGVTATKSGPVTVRSSAGGFWLSAEGTGPIRVSFETDGGIAAVVVLQGVSARSTK